ncbi:MAG: hypothetical protein WCR21_02520 [Bacteroidota bacterium]
MKHFFVCIFFFCAVISNAQYDQMARNAFINADMQEAFDYWNINQPNVKFHSSFKPYLSSTFSQANDSAIPFKFYAFKNFFFSKMLNEKPQKRIWYNVQAHPVLDVESGYDLLLQKPIQSLLGGTHLKININNDFTFAGTVYGGKSQFPFFLDTSIAKKRLIPELGQAYGKTGSPYTFFDFMGYVSYSPNNNKIFNFQLGRDKHFIGDGYRSLLLSDFAPAYPFFRINANFWRFQYNVWYSWMYDVTYANGIKDKFKNKFGSFHFLSYNILKELQVGLFENVIWRGIDTNQVRNFDPNYLNPIIFFRPVEYSIGSSDNSFLGLNLNATLFKHLKLYGQLAVDELFLAEIRAHRGWWANKQGWQLGAKYINALGIKGLKLQLEYNEVRPFTYTHGIVVQNYSHYGMPLAHPYGANFRELLGFVNYRHKRFELAWQGMRVLVGKDTANSKSNIGQNIFVSYNTRSMEYGNKTTQGIKTTVLQSSLKLTYYLVPDMNMRLELGYIQRSEKNSLGYILQNPYFYLGFKTSFWNSYRDF